jgi:hypothetical protein
MQRFMTLLCFLACTTEVPVPEWSLGFLAIRDTMLLLTQFSWTWGPWGSHPEEAAAPISATLSWSCHNCFSPTSWKLIVLQFWRMKIRGQGADMAGLYLKVLKKTLPFPVLLSTFPVFPGLLAWGHITAISASVATCYSPMSGYLFISSPLHINTLAIFD